MNDYYKVIPRNLCIIINSDHVLLLNGQAEKRHWAKMYNALGGHMEQQEDIYASIAREVREESGIKIPVNKISLKGIIHVNTYFDENVLMFIFFVKVKSFKKSDSHEGKVEWIKLNEIVNIKNIAEDIKIIIPLILKLKKGEFISGISSYNSNRTLKKFDYHIAKT